MERQDAIQEIKNRWREIICTITSPAKVKVNGETSYVCPICGHGTHGDGLTFNPRSQGKNSLICFGCEYNGDIIDLYMKTTGTDFNTAISQIADRLGIIIDPYKSESTYTPHTAAETGSNSLKNGTRDKFAVNANKESESGEYERTETHADYTEYYRKCKARIHDPEVTDYLKARGISPETAATYGIGYDPQADPTSSPGGTGTRLHPCKRIIIPVSKNFYITRRMDDEKLFRYMNPKGQIPGIFNQKILYAHDVQEIFVTEGAIDALSIIEAGASAIALNSASNADTLLRQLESKPTSATLVVSFDNDKAGVGATQRIIEGLKRLNIRHIATNLCGKYNDPNEALVNDKTAFIKAIEAAKQQASTRPDNSSHYIRNIMRSDIERFKNEIKTGYDNLDKKCGGLYAGLYCLAATSSLGKTSFAIQMADQIASTGNDVLFFSLEQSRLELVSKSISRTVALKDPTTNVTSLSIRKGYVTESVVNAATEYIDQVGNRISVIEGNFNCNIIFIGEYIRDYIRRTNTRPVVFIDYLQILQCTSGNKQSTKEMIDHSITELKRISREHELTVIVISSVNRANYLTPIDFESLKESGGIEYTCDVIWGLQLQCLNDDLFLNEKKAKEKRELIKQAKAESPRKIELSCLKNRYGIATYSCHFDYYPEHDLFTCSDQDASLEQFACTPWQRTDRI